VHAIDEPDEALREALDARRSERRTAPGATRLVVHERVLQPDDEVIVVGWARVEAADGGASPRLVLTGVEGAAGEVLVSAWPPSAVPFDPLLVTACVLAVALGALAPALAAWMHFAAVVP
jgi:hypothetical protein